MGQSMNEDDNQPLDLRQVTSQDDNLNESNCEGDEIQTGVEGD